MKVLKVAVSLLIVLVIGFGCWFGMDYFTARSRSVSLLNSETITDVTALPQTPTGSVETITDIISSMVLTSSKISSSAVNSSKVSSNHVSSTDKNTLKPSANTSSSSSSSSQISSIIKKPVVPLKKDKNLTEIVTYIKRPTYASVQKEIKALAKKYPDLVSVSSIGKSVQDRDLTLLKVGNGKTKALIVGGIHARESITVSYVMRCVEEFCVSYYSKSKKFGNFDIENLLLNYTLYIVPLSNPDGLEIIAGRAKSKVKINYREDMTIKDFKANANGVNLNKNFPLLWNKIDNKVSLPDPEGYKGSSAGSEPETKALMKLCKNHDFAWMTSVHVRGDCVYWSDSLNPTVGASEKIVNVLKERCDFYKCDISTDINGFGGGFENWFRNQFKRPGLCLELMPLDVQVSPLSDANHSYFSRNVRWDITKKVFPLIMVYGFPSK